MSNYKKKELYLENSEDSELANDSPDAWFLFGVTLLFLLAGIIGYVIGAGIANVFGT